MTDHDLAAAYAVDALSPAERESFEAHLGSCVECREEVSSLADVTASLGDAEALAPPSGLRTRVLASATATAQEGAVVPVRRLRRWPVVAAVAASLLVLTGVGVVAGSAYQTRQDELAMQHDIMMVTTAPDAHAMPLDLGTSHLVMSPSMGAIVAMGENAPIPSDGMEYQVWLVMADGTKMAGPTFMPAADGSFTAYVAAPMDGVMGVAVTEEPMGGSDAPTGEMVAEVRL